MKNTYKNPGLLFGKHYFQGIDFTKHNENSREKKNADKENQEIIDKNNRIVLGSKIDKKLIPEIYSKTQQEINSKTQQKTNSKTEQFELTTIYPGLLSGSGYAHEGAIEGELKLGFFFDHTTGLPVIPGSSVKGVLRSAFKKSHEYIKNLLGNDEINIKDLENNIFMGIDANGKELPIYQRDIFLDAFPVASANDGGQIFADDYITPHKEPLKNPVPLKFLKILPGVTFRFDFILHGFENKEGQEVLSAAQKCELFKKILFDFGVGAKTNVGYGQFVSDDNKNKQNSSNTKKEETRLNNISSFNEITDGMVLNARIIKLSGGVFFDLEINDVPFNPRLIGVSSKGFKIGQIINIYIEKSGEKYKFSLIQ